MGVAEQTVRARQARLASGFLPSLPTEVIGREREQEAVCRQLRQQGARLVTITGEPGIGKTRLALAVAASLAPSFEHGAWWVPLAEATTRDDLVLAIAARLGIQEFDDAPDEARLVDFLRPRSCLLVLDNLEQVADVAVLLGSLLRACPSLWVLATSRRLLRVEGEHLYPLEPLETPEPIQASARGLRRSPAVRLFVARARAVLPDFSLEANSDDARAVAEICVRLDGLPLAIELAAASLRWLRRPVALLQALDTSPFGALSGGHADGPRRHATMHAAIAWSYDLLPPQAQTLFRRLALFVGGFTEAAARAVADAAEMPGPSLVRFLPILMDHSLVRSQPGVWREPRFRLLEPMRAFAGERLVAAGEDGAMAQAHTAHFLGLAETAGEHLWGPQQRTWLERLECEHRNLGVAVRRALDYGDAVTGMRLVSALWVYLAVCAQRGRVSEARSWVEGLLQLPASHVPAPLRARTMTVAGALAAYQDVGAAREWYQRALALWSACGHASGEGWALLGLGQLAERRRAPREAVDYLERSLERFRQAGDRVGLAWARVELGVAQHALHDDDAALASFEEALTLWRAIDDAWGLGTVLRHLANLAYARGDLDRAAAAYLENVQCFMSLDLRAALAWSLNALGEVERGRGRLVAARTYYQDALDHFRALHDRAGTAWAVHNLGALALAEGAPSAAASHFRESLATFQSLGIRAGVAACVMGLAGAAAADNQDALALRGLGAVASWAGAGAERLEPVDRAAFCQLLAQLERRLDEASRQRAWAEGLARGLEAVAAELRGDETPQARPVPPIARDGVLTPREREVAVLVAEGLTNREIAAHLNCGERTIEKHVEHILQRLAMGSRAEIAAWVARGGLSQRDGATAGRRARGTRRGRGSGVPD